MVNKRLLKWYFIIILILIARLDFRARYTKSKAEITLSETPIVNVQEFTLPSKRLHFNRNNQGGISYFRHQSIWNPSIIQIDDKFLMFFRFSQYFFDFPSINPLTWKRTRDYLNLYGIWLDTNLNPISNYFSISPKFEDGSLISCPEDPRFHEHNGEIYCFFNHFYTLNGADHNQIFVSKLRIDQMNVELDKAKHLIHPITFARREKNWMPFSYKNELFIIYKTSPFEIVKLDTTTFQLTSEKSNPNSFSWVDPYISGSTPAIDYKGEKLTFIHSFERTKSVLWKHLQTSIYTFGAFTFSNDPFAITKYTETPLGFPYFYKPNYNKSKLLFPSDLVKLSEEKALLTLGIGDEKILFLTIDLDALVKEMKPLK